MLEEFEDEPAHREVGDFHRSRQMHLLRVDFAGLYAGEIALEDGNVAVPIDAETDGRLGCVSGLSCLPARSMLNNGYLPR